MKHLVMSMLLWSLLYVPLGINFILDLFLESPTITLFCGSHKRLIGNMGLPFYGIAMAAPATVI